MELNIKQRVLPRLSSAFSARLQDKDYEIVTSFDRRSKRTISEPVDYLYCGMPSSLKCFMQMIH